MLMKRFLSAVCAALLLMSGCADKPAIPAQRQSGFINPNIYTTDFNALYDSILTEMGAEEKRIAPAFYVDQNTVDIRFSGDGTITSFNLILLAEEDRADWDWAAGYDWDYIMGYYFVDAISDETGISGFQITPNDEFTTQKFAKGLFEFDFGFVDRSFKLLNSSLFAHALEQYKTDDPIRYRIVSDHIRESDLSNDTQIVFLNCNVDSGYQPFEGKFNKSAGDDPYLSLASGGHYLAVLGYDDGQNTASGCIIFVV